jgi:alkanesulfonate monooxygenase SsuD/methylene tetrahydromethanopterin reductase-like flavin-dependent oxidoreductase (luciferase family)
MRYSINVPNFGEFADARTIASLAVAAERAGWDALFLWDHVVHVKSRRQSFGDTWMLLTAAALATTRIRLGPMVTPVARRRPQQLARQVGTLDRLSGGRVTLGVGLGGPIEDEYGSFGEPTDPVVLAELLDEGLDLLEEYWSGRAVHHSGRHYQVKDVTLLPTPVQRPRVPIWVAGYWPNRRPMRRAARWDGAVPLFHSARHGQVPDPGEVRDLAAYIGEHREGPPGRPFEIVVGGMSPTDPAGARDLLGPLIDAGATWWDERRPAAKEIGLLAPVMRRVEEGPPAV